ncbi:hypothetical protein Cocul_00949 [Corynebacterium oculi]|uniref:DUF218 domain-containing protein n=1 Tax=Corynebacterium oculi TaxID=1544416 RepID=A0A0Q1AC10_9CORY|nr:hypothetical protein Cocul_00949 [Corynebacterium oculi]
MPVLVLGARLRRGAVGPMLEARLAAALARYQAAPPGEKPTVVVSGKGEAPAMARWLAARGVPEEHLVVEAQAESTNENLENAYALLPRAGQWVVVTNGFHVWRTRLWIWHLRLPMRVVGAPTPGRRRPVTYAREALAVAHSSARIVWRRAAHTVRTVRAVRARAAAWSFPSPRWSGGVPRTPCRRPPRRSRPRPGALTPCAGSWGRRSSR